MQVLYTEVIVEYMKGMLRESLWKKRLNVGAGG